MRILKKRVSLKDHAKEKTVLKEYLYGVNNYRLTKFRESEIHDSECGWPSVAPMG